MRQRIRKTLSFLSVFLLLFVIYGCTEDKTCEEDPNQEKCASVEKSCDADPTQEKCKSTEKTCQEDPNQEKCKPTEKTCEEDPNQEKCAPTGKTCQEDPNQEKCDGPVMVDYSDVLNVEYRVIFEAFDSNIEDIANFVYMGKYPQREVTDASLLKKLERITTTNKDGYLEYNGMEFVKLTITNTHIPLGSSDGLFQMNTGYIVGTTHYFLVEPILWKVINTVGNKSMLMTYNIIDAKMFQSNLAEREINGITIYPSNYEHSDIRNWLNNDFYSNYFTDDDRAVVVNTLVSNKAKNYPNVVLHRDNDTYENFFLPSYEEVIKRSNNFEATGIFSISRIITPSDYARAQGVHTEEIDFNLSGGIWLLRAAQNYVKSFSAYVKADGYANADYYLNSPSTGIRVACYANVPFK